MPKIQVSPKAKAITTDQKFESRCNALLLQNDGTGDIYIDDVFRIKPGATLALGDWPNVEIVWNIVIRFQGNGSNRLQILEMVYQGDPNPIDNPK